MFQSDRDGDFDIYSMNADGTDIQQLTNDPAYDDNPAWSPDGTKIAFARDVSGVGSDPYIYLMNADGSSIQLVTSKAKGWAPAWSPDGDKLAFSGWSTSCCDDYGWEIYVIDADGQGLQRLTRGPRPIPETTPIDSGDPSWSPDGGTISFARWGLNPPIRTGIWLMKSDGSNQTFFAEGYGSPDWSPDGRTLSFSGDDGLYLIGSDGSNRRRVLAATDTYLRPAWSPTGTRIAFGTTTSGGDYEIYSMNADGSDTRRLTNEVGIDYDPDWTTTPIELVPSPIQLVAGKMLDSDTYRVEYKAVRVLPMGLTFVMKFVINGATLSKIIPMPSDIDDHEIDFDLSPTVPRFSENQYPTITMIGRDERGYQFDETFPAARILLPVVAVHGILSDVASAEGDLLLGLDRMWDLGVEARRRWGYESLRLGAFGPGSEDPNQYPTWSDFVPSSFAGLWTQVDGLKSAIDESLRRTYANRVNLVGHSMGGLLARGALARFLSSVNDVVAIGSPHQGSALVYQPLPGRLPFGAEAAFLASDAAKDLYPLWDALWECTLGSPPCLFGERAVEDQHHSVFLKDLNNIGMPVDRLTAVCSGGSGTLFTVWKSVSFYQQRSSIAGDGTVPYVSCAWGSDIVRAGDQYNHGSLPIAPETMSAIQRRFDLED